MEESFRNRKPNRLCTGATGVPPAAGETSSGAYTCDADGLISPISTSEQWALGARAQVNDSVIASAAVQTYLDRREPNPSR